MHRLRSLLSTSSLCVALGLGGGLLLGWVLSRNGGWLTPIPWAVYLGVMLAAVAAVSWLESGRTAQREPDMITLPPDYERLLAPIGAEPETAAPQAEAQPV